MSLIDELEEPELECLYILKRDIDHLSMAEHGKYIMEFARDGAHTDSRFLKVNESFQVLNKIFEKFEHFTDRYDAIRLACEGIYARQEQMVLDKIVEDEKIHRAQKYTQLEEEARPSLSLKEKKYSFAQNLKTSDEAYQFLDHMIDLLLQSASETVSGMPDEEQFEFRKWIYHEKRNLSYNNYHADYEQEMADLILAFDKLPDDKKHEAATWIMQEQRGDIPLNMFIFGNEEYARYLDFWANNAPISSEQYIKPNKINAADFLSPEI